ncbi:MAG: hypothetical protein JWP75_764 [Frondihabitans sp.]|nr:hypothetical protein [Frondihabitans sp.]
MKGEDADAATRLLLRLRAACLAVLDAECLRGVDDAGSSALEADLAAVDDPALLAGRPIGLTLTLAVNRLGGSVVYRAATDVASAHEDDQQTARITEPASVLVTKTEAGWRLRDVSRATR